MIALARFAIAFALSISALAVFPQQSRAPSSLADMQSAMLGDWVLTFPNPGWGRGRLTITTMSQNSDGSFQIIGMYAYGDKQTAALKSGELTQSGSTLQFNFTTALGGVFVAKSQGEGGFQGELTPAKGPKTTFKMEKVEGQSVAAAAPRQDSINTRDMAEARQAVEHNPVKRPYVEAGDCWTYRKTSVSKKDKFGDLVHDYTSCVTYVDYSKDVIFAVSSSGGDGTDHTYTTEWNPVTNDRAVRTTKSHFLQFPLHLGDTYSFEADYRMMNNPQQERNMKWNMRVVGWDDVTVPAGTFRAVRIEGIGIGMVVNAARRQSQRQSRVTMWYVPEVNRDVKTIWVHHSGTVVDELTQYRLNR